MNNTLELFFRAELERLVSERAGMIALNQQREHCGESLAYSEDAFLAISKEFVALQQRMLHVGRGELLRVMWCADFVGDSEAFYLFKTEEQAKAMLGELEGTVYAVEIRKMPAKAMVNSGEA